MTADPIFAAITTALEAESAHTAALRGLNENDEAQMRRANAAADRSAEAWQALGTVSPTTMGGLCALIRCYARHAEIYEGWSFGAEHFGQLAAVLEIYDPALALANLERREAA